MFVRLFIISRRRSRRRKRPINVTKYFLIIKKGNKKKIFLNELQNSFPPKFIKNGGISGYDNNTIIMIINFFFLNYVCEEII